MKKTTAKRSDLLQLATQANRLHAHCEKAIRSGLEYARQCGEALHKAKTLLGHGNFEAWVEKHCKFSARQARRYMTISAGWAHLLQLSNRTRASDLPIDSLSVREALRLLSAGGQEAQPLIYLDQCCPSCGERLVVSSKLYATCPACWNCRLYPNPLAKEFSQKLPKPRGAKGAVNALARVEDPGARAEAIAAILANLDGDTTKMLVLFLKGGRIVEKAAAERVAELARLVEGNDHA